MANEFKIKKGLIVTGSGGTLLDVQGSVGQVFSVTDSLTGDIFSVSDVSGIPIFNVNSDGTVTIDGNIKLADNDKIQLGDDQDLELYHDGTHSYISDNGTGELRFIANGATRFKIGSDVASFSGTDFAIAAARKLYLDGQSNTYITESSADTIKIFTGGTEILELANNAATFSGTVTVEGDHILINKPNNPTYLRIGNNLADDAYVYFGTDTYDWAVGVDRSAGKFSINNYSSLASNPEMTLDGSGNATFSGSVTAGGDVVAFSDKRLKTNIKTLDGSKVYEMRGVSFTKDDKEGSGVIAQELEKIAPELVNSDSEYKAVAYGNITGYLIEAIKELKEEIEELKKQIK